MVIFVVVLFFIICFFIDDEDWFCDCLFCDDVCEHVVAVLILFKRVDLLDSPVEEVDVLVIIGY